MSSLRVHFVFYCLLYVSSFVSVSSLPEGFPLPTSTSYGTLGIETDFVIENNVYMFSSEHIITTPGSIDRFTIALHGDRNYPFTPILRSTASIEIVVARRVDGGEYFIQTARTREYTGVQHLVEYTLDTPFVVQQDDLIGFHITTPGVYAAWDDPGSSVGALPSSIRKREETEAVDRPNIRFPPINPMISIWYTSSSEGNVALSTEQTTAKPRFTFTVEQGVEITLPTATIPPIDDPQTTLPPRNNAPTGGDPQIGGFQGQSYQFHGLADEIFNLISTPTMQLNSHFVYLSSGKCDYNNTVCFQHPGTYLDVLGFTIPSQQGDVHVKFVAGSHEKGLRVWMGHGDAEMTEISVGKYKHGLKWVMGNDTTQIASVKYNTFGEAEISTPLIHIKVINSDYFFNLEVSLLDRELLRIGSTKHTITDHNICHHDKHGHAQVNEAGENLHAQHDHGMVEAQLMKKYHTDFPIHGLIGQTWRNVLVCGKHWMGGVNDYVVSSLFGSDYFYNFYKSQ